MRTARVFGRSYHVTRTTDNASRRHLVCKCLPGTAREEMTVSPAVCIGNPAEPCHIKTAETGCSLFLTDPSLGQPSFTTCKPGCATAYLQNVLVDSNPGSGRHAFHLRGARDFVAPVGLHRKCKGRSPVQFYGMAQEAFPKPEQTPPRSRPPTLATKTISMADVINTALPILTDTYGFSRSFDKL